MERGLRSHQFQSVGASGTRYSLVPLRPQVFLEEKERGEWKGFAGEIRREMRNVEARLAAKQTHAEEATAAAIAALQKHMEDTFAAKLTHIEETTAANFSRIEAQLERLVEAYPKTAQPEGS